MDKKETETINDIQALSRKQQRRILKKLFSFAWAFKRQFLTAIIFAIGLSVINIILPRLLQFYMDHYLVHQDTGIQIIIGFAIVYFIGTIIKAIVQFIQNFAFSMGAERTLESIRSQLFHKLHTLGMAKRSS